MKVAITGTPGVGKTTVCRVLAERGFDVVHLNEVARELDAIIEEDEVRRAKVVDLYALRRYVEEWEPESEPAFVESHYSHLMPVDAVVVIRLHPAELERRLKERGYPPEKIAENLEAEFVGVCFGEAVNVRTGGCGMVRPEAARVYQIDATGLTKAELADRVLEVLEEGKGDRVDWLGDEEARKVVESYLEHRS
ncbi:MAG: AAA family ATPase [Methanopyri archaeon]|nr:AAA family ATPase [Methanopyri archaeon]